MVSADSDFGTILASTSAQRPSVIYVRRAQGRRVEQLVEVLLANLSQYDEAVEEGCLVVVGEGTVRIRRLPIL